MWKVLSITPSEYPAAGSPGVTYRTISICVEINGKYLRIDLSSATDNDKLLVDFTNQEGKTLESSDFEF